MAICCFVPSVKEENDVPNETKTSIKASADTKPNPQMFVRQTVYSSSATSAPPAPSSVKIPSSLSPVIEIEKKVVESKSVESDLDKLAFSHLKMKCLSLTADEMRKATNDFGRDSYLGEGSTGRVHVGKLENGSIVAVRVLNPDDQSEEDFLNQVRIVSNLKHENVLKLVAFCAEGSTRILANEYAPRGSLYDLLHGRKGRTGVNTQSVLTWLQRVRIVMCIARGLLYLHESNHGFLTYKCIKSSNIMLFDGDVAKIGDFNITKPAIEFSSTFDSDQDSIKINPSEQLYIQKSDVYAFGIILLEILTGRKPMDTTMPQNQQSLISWAMARLSPEKVKHIVDPRLKRKFPLDWPHRMGMVAALCMDDFAYRPGMRDVITALRPLLMMKMSSSHDSIKPRPTSISAYNTPLHSQPVSRLNSRSSSLNPSLNPSRASSRTVSRAPSQPPSQPTSRPSSRPSSRPTSRPTSRPSSRPSSRPTSKTPSRSTSPVRTHSYLPRSTNLAYSNARVNASYPQSNNASNRKSSLNPNSAPSTPAFRF